MNNLNLDSLIDKIAPLNNKYRIKIKNQKNGVEILEIMWDVGNILKIEKIGKIHSVAWQIYGKSAGIKKSNITRDFISYCFRIRNYFKKRDDIKKNFFNLKKYSLFREAFPLLENPKYKLLGKDLEKLKLLLNSTESISRIKGKIVFLKKNRIGISNPRTQRINEFKTEALLFVTLYKNLKMEIVDEDIITLENIRKIFDQSNAKLLAKLLLSLTQEGLKLPKYDIRLNESSDWYELLLILGKFTKKSVEDRNRLRRLIPPKYMSRLAEMISAIYNQNELKMLRNSLGNS